MWVGVGLVAGFVIAVLVLLVAGVFGEKTLDQAAVQKGVEEIVIESYGARTVTGVSCPPEQKVIPGAWFECDLTVDGRPRTVRVTFTDTDGTYEVARPK
ncbi:DUF4333 domain-containing protein [Rhodococcus xishaensis]|nr:DUF4333 domain-containing protein [Rhodococcus xishaensis]